VAVNRKLLDLDPRSPEILAPLLCSMSRSGTE